LDPPSSTLSVSSSINISPVEVDWAPLATSGAKTLVENVYAPAGTLEIDVFAHNAIEFAAFCNHTEFDAGFGAVIRLPAVSIFVVAVTALFAFVYISQLAI
jgi:hypothetical protein